MATKAITQQKPTNEGTDSLLAFNQEGLIDVFLFNDTTDMAKQLGLDVNLQIPLPDLANANMLYQISQELKLVPGEEDANDKQIVTYLTQKISDNILNKDVVVSEIIDSWNKIATLKISQQYDNFKTTNNKTHLAFQGAYELTLREYITTYISKLTAHNQLSNWVLGQAAEILESTREGRPFSTCPYERMDTLIRLAEECKVDIRSSEKAIDTIKTKLNREHGKWFTDIAGLIRFEIENAMDEFKSAEIMQTKSEKADDITAAQHTLENIRTTLKCLLNKDYANIPKETSDLFEQTIQLIQNPLLEAFHKLLVEKPSAEEVILAIKYNINKVLKEQKFSLYSKKIVDPLLALADQTNEQSIEQLTQALLDEKNNFPAGRLNSIFNKTKNESIKEIIRAIFNSYETTNQFAPIHPPILPKQTQTLSSEEWLLKHLLETPHFSREVLNDILSKSAGNDIIKEVIDMKQRECSQTSSLPQYNNALKRKPEVIKPEVIIDLEDEHLDKKSKPENKGQPYSYPK